MERLFIFTDNRRDIELTESQFAELERIRKEYSRRVKDLNEKQRVPINTGDCLADERAIGHRVAFQFLISNELGNIVDTQPDRCRK